MIGIIRYQGGSVFGEEVSRIHDARTFRRFRGFIRHYDKDGWTAFGIILTGLRVIYVDGSGRLTQQGEILAGVTDDMIVGRRCWRCGSRAR